MKRRGQFKSQFSIWPFDQSIDVSFFLFSFGIETAKRFGNAKWQEKKNETKKKFHPVPCSGHKLVVDNQRKRNVYARVCFMPQPLSILCRTVEVNVGPHRIIKQLNGNGNVGTRFTRNLRLKFQNRSRL